MKKQILLCFAFLPALLGLQAQTMPALSTGTSTTYYYIKFKNGGAVAQDMGPGTTLKTAAQTAYNLAQLWKVEEVSKGSGTYYLTSGLGNKVNFNSNFTTNTTGIPLYFRATTNSTYKPAWEISRSASGSCMNQNGGAGVGKTISEWNFADPNNPLEFVFAETVSNDNLGQAILNAKYKLYTLTTEGNNPGQYSSETRAIFLAAINAAIEVSNNATATSEEKNSAISTLSTAQTQYLAKYNNIKLSTTGNDVWYYIVSANPTYSNGQVMANQNSTPGTSILFTSKSVDPNKLWRFVDAGNGKIGIQNKASGLYISTAPATATTPGAYNATFLGEDAQYTFNADGKNPLHAQQAGSVIVTWAGGLNSASAWRMEELPAADNNLPVAITSAILKQGFTETGIGNTNHPLAYTTVTASGLEGSVSIKSFVVDLTGTTDINAVKCLKLYATGADVRLKPTKHTLLAQVDNPTSTTGTIEMKLNTPYTLPLGSTNFFLAVDVAENAKEGTLIDNSMQSIKYTYKENRDTTYTLTTQTTPFATTVFLKQAILFSPGDYNSVSYRIPAITTAADGSLVTITDKRKYNSGDLPGDIDLLSKRSTDGGKTWSEPVTVALGTGSGKGFGDAAIITAKSGKLVAVFVGGTGLWSSTADKPIRTYVSTSSDNGLTWTTPTDITSQLFGTACTDAIRKFWYTSFCGSGHGLCTRSGRIMVVGAVGVPNESGLQNYAFYSDDEGITWKVSNRAISGGDEAKVVELNDGSILMSSRTSGNRLWAKSTDGGINWGSKNSWSQIWGNACDADIVRYTSTLDGYDKNRLLHTLPNASDRSNLTMWISYNEGSTWPTKKTLCPGTSAYSSITILPDGTIGVYYELDGSNPYTMNFINFSLNWLTSGADSYTPAKGSDINNTKIPAIRVSTENGKIIVHGSDKTPRIYNMAGSEVDATKPLQAGVYVVRIEKDTRKVVVQ